MMPGRSKIRLRDLDFFHGSRQALRSIAVEVPDRQVMGLIGASGSGKSTLLRVLNRLYDLQPGQRATGTVLLDGENILEPGTDLVGLRRRVGMVFATPTAFPMSIQDNIAFAVQLQERLSRADMQARVEQALTRVALWDSVKDRLRSPAHGLDAGQQQLLCIARIIATGPEVILLDEPAGALDPAGASRVEEALSTLKGDFTIVIGTRNLRQAARCADHVAFLDRGELVEAGSAAQIFTAPRQERTQAYITGRAG